jgi:tripartite-type tricarboxylate transporter receptor subunit TctC
MVGEVYKKRANLELTHVPYKGTAPAVQDFVAGHVPLLVETPSAVWEHLKAGTAVPLAVTSSARMPQMPSVPTFKELGYADIVFDTWQGIVTRRGVPPAVLEALNRELVKALRSPDVVRSHEEQVNVVVANTPEQFERFIADETRKWTLGGQRNRRGGGGRRSRPAARFRVGGGSGLQGACVAALHGGWAVQTTVEAGPAHPLRSRNPAPRP